MNPIDPLLYSEAKPIDSFDKPEDPYIGYHSL